MMNNDALFSPGSTDFANDIWQRGGGLPIGISQSDGGDMPTLPEELEHHLLRFILEDSSSRLLLLFWLLRAKRFWKHVFLGTVDEVNPHEPSLGLSQKYPSGSKLPDVKAVLQNCFDPRCLTMSSSHGRLHVDLPRPYTRTPAEFPSLTSVSARSV